MQIKPLTVLHVEDNDDHARLVARALADYCVTDAIHLVNNGEAALDYLFRRGKFKDPAKSPRPNMVLLDLRLPKVDGLDVLAAIKTNDELASIPVVILTSSQADADLLRAYKNHTNSYLVKPLGFKEFTQMIAHMGFYWLCWNSYPEQEDDEENAEDEWDAGSE